MAGSQTSENESIVEHPTQLLKRQNHISYLRGFYTTGWANIFNEDD